MESQRGFCTAGSLSRTEYREDLCLLCTGLHRLHVPEKQNSAFYQIMQNLDVPTLLMAQLYSIAADSVYASTKYFSCGSFIGGIQVKQFLEVLRR